MSLRAEHQARARSRSASCRRCSADSRFGRRICLRSVWTPGARRSTTPSPQRDFLQKEHSRTHPQGRRDRRQALRLRERTELGFQNRAAEGQRQANLKGPAGRTRRPRDAENLRRRRKGSSATRPQSGAPPRRRRKRAEADAPPPCSPGGGGGVARQGRSRAGGPGSRQRRRHGAPLVCPIRSLRASISTAGPLRPRRGWAGGGRPLRAGAGGTAPTGRPPGSRSPRRGSGSDTSRGPRRPIASPCAAPTRSSPRRRPRLGRAGRPPRDGAASSLPRACSTITPPTWSASDAETRPSQSRS